MMKFVCVDPLLTGGKISSYTVFDDKYQFLYHHFESKDYERYANAQEYTAVCFDAFKSMKVFSDRYNLQDVKILYELTGKKFHDLIELGVDTLGRERFSRYLELSDKVKAHLKSYQVMSINCGKYEQQRLFPEGLLEDLYRERAGLIIELYKKLSEEDKEFYGKFYTAVKTLHEISQKPLLIDTSALDQSHFSALIKKYTKNGLLTLQFEAVGAKTGRLGFKKKTPSIYHIPKELRKCIVPRPGYSIAQFDFKSFQPRLAIFSTDEYLFKKKFENVEDIYSVFEGDREENKILFIAWMFSSMRNESFEKQALPIKLLRQQLFDRAQKDKKLINKFGRPLPYHGEKDNVVFQNYITSLEVDTILCLMVMLHELLNPHEARIMFPFHDALVFEIRNDVLDRTIEYIKRAMKDWFEQVFMAAFPVEVQIGSSFFI